MEELQGGAMWCHVVPQFVNAKLLDKSNFTLVHISKFISLGDISLVQGPI